MSTQLFTITQLAKELDITPRAVRFYEDKGLLSPDRAGTTRVYTQRDRARLILILRGKRLGFTLSEIKEYLELYDLDRTQRTQIKQLLARVGDRVDKLKAQREALEQTLVELAEIERQAIEALVDLDAAEKATAQASTSGPAKAGETVG